MATTLLIVAIVIFVAGAAVGAILLVSWGIQREERDFSLTRQAPGQVSLGTRRVTGLYVRRRTDLSPSLARREDTLVSAGREPGRPGPRGPWPACQRGASVPHHPGDGAAQIAVRARPAIRAPGLAGRSPACPGRSAGSHGPEH